MEQTKRINAKQETYHAKKRCIEQFGFQANPRSSIRQNFNTAIKNENLNTPMLPTNLTFHDLTIPGSLPPNTKQLLGLNLKFCVASNFLPNTINKTIRNLAYSIRTKEALKEANIHQNSTYIKQIYLKNPLWNPPPASIEIEDKITEFEKAIKKAHNNLILRHEKSTLRNLTKMQLQVLTELKSNNDIIIKPTDKNLGPAVMQKDAYIRQVLEEHLLTDDYLQLTEEEAKRKIDNLKLTLISLINNSQNLLSQAERTFFQRSFKLRHRLPIFYGLPKVHKDPVKLRPVVSNTNSFLAIFSTWLDYKFKTLLPHVKSYIKNSTAVINDIKDMTLPQEAKLFSADAMSMYTNISTDVGILYIQHFIQENINKIPHDFPTELFLNVLELIMKNNIFTFGHSYWLQLSGTAMGTPAACAYATVSYGQYENSVILPKYENNLTYFKRYIDDIFGIWLPTQSDDTQTWESFKRDLNSWGSLTWVTEEPSLSTNFLDLNIKILDNKVQTSTFQKTSNLYLYLPPKSAHPSSCLKGLITGELKRYWSQNTPDNFKEMLANFIHRLLQRGHTIPNLTPLLLKAATTLDNTCNLAASNGNATNTLYLHWPYHPKGLQRQQIRRLYDATLKPALPEYDNMQIAVSRPKNLRDLLTKTALNTTDNAIVTNILIEKNAHLQPATHQSGS